MNKISLETVGESSMGGMLDGAHNLVSSWRIASAAKTTNAAMAVPHPSSKTTSATGSSGGGTTALVASGTANHRAVLLSSTQSGPDAALNFW